MKSLIFLFIAISAGACAGESNEDNAQSAGALTKANGGSNGDSDYCNSLIAPCVTGEGDCDSNLQCAGLLVCHQGAGPDWGMAADVDVCAPIHCGDGLQNFDESGLDCGGSCAPCPVEIIESAAFDAVRGAAVDSSDNVYVVGQFGAAVDLGGGTSTPVGERDIFVSKYDAQHDHVWSTVVGGTAFDDGQRIAITSTGTVVVAGRFTDQMTVGSTLLTAVGGVDIFLTELDTSGNILWAVSFGGLGDEFISDIATDSSGYYLSGGFNQTIDLGGGTRTSAGFQDGFIAKFNTAGVYQWDHAFGSADTEYIGDVTVDQAGKVWLAGTFFNTLTIGTETLVSAGGSDAFLVRFDSDGNVERAQQFGATGNDIGRGVRGAPDGGVIFSGAVAGTVLFGIGLVVSIGGRDGFVASLDSTGDTIWVSRFGGLDDDEGRSIAVAPNGDIAVASIFRGQVTFGVLTIGGGGSYDSVVSRWDSDGVWIDHAQVYATTKETFVTDVAFASGGQLVATGYFQGVGEIGGHDVSSSGRADGFVHWSE